MTTVTPSRIAITIVPRPATPHRVTVQTLCSPGFRSTVSYHQAMRTVIDYLHNQRLQNPHRRTHFALDAILCRLLQLPSTSIGQQYSYQELGRYLRSDRE